MNYYYANNISINIEPMYLDNTTNLIQVYTLSGTASATIQTSTDTKYKYVQLTDPSSSYGLVINTNITVDDDLNFIVVGGGGGGMYGWGSGSNPSGGGGGGIVTFKYIFNTALMMGTQFSANIGIGGIGGDNLNRPITGTNGGNTFIKYLLSDNIFLNGEGGQCVMNTFNVSFQGGNASCSYSFLGNVAISGNNDGSHSQNGLPSSTTNLPNKYTLPYDNLTLTLSGGGGRGGTGVSINGGLAGNGIGGTGIGNSQKSGQNATTFGAGGGGGGTNSSSVSQVGGNGKSGLVYIYWKIRS